MSLEPTILAAAQHALDALWNTLRFPKNLDQMLPQGSLEQVDESVTQDSVKPSEETTLYYVEIGLV